MVRPWVATWETTVGFVVLTALSAEWLTRGVVKQTLHDKGQFVTSCGDAQHHLGDVTDEMVNQNTHERGQSVTCITTLNTFTLQS